MQFNNRNYPHPILGISDDYQGVHISIQFNVKSNLDTTSLSPIFKIDDPAIAELVKRNLAVYVTHVYCRGTLFREVFKDSHPLAGPIEIPSNKLNGEVEVDFFIVSNKEIADYSNEAFNEDYSRATFSLGASEVLAYGGKAIFYANKSPEELRSVSALMNIDCMRKHNSPMYLDYTGQKITLLLCDEDYQHYRLVKDNKQHLGVLLSSLVLPALVEALHFLDNEESDEFKDSAWYKALSELRDKSTSREPLEIAQMILDSPIDRFFKSLVEDEESFN